MDTANLEAQMDILIAEQIAGNNLAGFTLGTLALIVLLLFIIAANTWEIGGK